MPSALEHSLFGILIWAMAFLMLYLYRRTVSKNTDAFVLFWYPTLYYLSREMRDWQKAGFFNVWDWLAPTLVAAGLSITYGVLCASGRRGSDKEIYNREVISHVHDLPLMPSS